MVFFSNVLAFNGVDNTIRLPKRLPALGGAFGEGFYHHVVPTGGVQLRDALPQVGVLGHQAAVPADTCLLRTPVDLDGCILALHGIGVAIIHGLPVVLVEVQIEFPDYLNVSGLDFVLLSTTRTTQHGG